MSTVDERVVKMLIDTEQFEKGIKDAVKSLDSLKMALDMESSAKSLSNLEKNLSGFSMGNLITNIEKATNKFHILYNAGQKIADMLSGRLADSAVKFAKSLSIDNISAGFSKYEQRLKSTQSLISNAKIDSDKANAIMDKLMWYTDETSYHYENMVENMTSMVNAGMAVDDAASAIIGVANACGLAGVEAGKADHAFIGFQRAISGGKMNAQAWSFIHTAGADSKMLADQFIQAGLASGTLVKQTKRINGQTQEVVLTSRKLGKQIEVTAENISTTFGKDWLTTKEIEAGLKNFSNYTEKVYEEYERSGDLTQDIVDRLDDVGMQLGKEAFLASNISRTFGDVINAVKDAVSTQWARAYTSIFGNEAESAKIWSYANEYLWDIFAQPLERLNDALSDWHNNGGFDAIFSMDEDKPGAIRNYLEGFRSIIRTFDEVGMKLFFGSDTEDGPTRLGAKLVELSEKVKEMSQGFEISEKTLNFLRSALESTWSVVRSGTSIIGSTISLIKKVISMLKPILAPIFRPFGNAIKWAIEGLDKFASAYKDFVDGISEDNTLISDLTKVAEFIGGIFTRIGKFLGPVIGKAFKGLKIVLMGVNLLLSAIINTVKGVGQAISGFLNSDTIYDKFEPVLNFFKNLLDKLSNLFKGKDIFGKAKQSFIGLEESIVGFGVSLNVSGIVGKVWNYILKGVNGLSSGFERLRLSINKSGILTTFVSKLRRVHTATKNYLAPIKNYILQQSNAFVAWARNINLLEEVPKWFQKIWGVLKSVWANVSSVAIALFDLIAEAIYQLTGFDIKTITWETVIEVINKLKDALSNLIPYLKDGAQLMVGFGTAVSFKTFEKIVDIFSGTGPKVTKFFQSFKKSIQSPTPFLKTLTGDIKNGTFSINQYIEALKKTSKAYDAVSIAAASFIPNMEMSGDAMANVGDALENIWNVIKEKAANFSISKAVSVGLVSSFIPAIFGFAKLETSAAEFLTNIKGVTDAFTGVLNAFKGIAGSISGIGLSISDGIKTLTTAFAKAPKYKAILFTAIAIIAVTAALGYLVHVAQQEGGVEALAAAGEAMFTIAGALMMVTVAAAGLAQASGGKLVWAIIAVASLVGAIAILAVTLKKLEGIHMDQMGDGLIAIGILLAALTGFSFLLSKTVPTLTSNMWQTIAFAGAIYILVLALEKIVKGDIKFNSISEMLSDLGPIIILMVGLAGICASVGMMRFGNIISFGLFVLLLGKFIKRLSELDAAVGEMKNPQLVMDMLWAISEIIIAIGVMSTIFSAVAGKEKGFAKGLASMAIIVGSIIGLSFAMSLLGSIPKDAFANIVGLMTIMGVAYVAFMALSMIFTEFGNGGWDMLALVGFAFSLLAVAVAFKMLGGVTLGGNTLLVLFTIVGIVAVLTVVVNVLKALDGTWTNSIAIVGIAAAIVLLAVALKAMESLDVDGLLWRAAALATIMIAFGFMAKMADGSKAHFGSLLALIFSVVMLVAALFLLQAVDFKGVWKQTILLSVLMLSFAAMLFAAKAIGKDGVKSIIAMIALVGMLMAFLIAMSLIEKIDITKMVYSAIALAMLIAAISVALMALERAANGPAKAGTFVALAGALLIVSIAVVALAVAIKTLNGMGVQEIVYGMLSLATGLIAMCAALFILGEISGPVWIGIGALYGLIVAMFFLSAAILALRDAFSANPGKSMLGSWIRGIKDGLKGTDSVASEMIEKAEAQNTASKKLEESNARAEEAIAGGTGGAKPNVTRKRNIDRDQSRFNSAIDRATEYAIDRGSNWILKGNKQDQLATVLGMDPEAGVWNTITDLSQVTRRGEETGNAYGESVIAGVANAAIGENGNLLNTLFGENLIGEGEDSIGALFGNGISLGALSANTSVKDMAEDAGITLEEAASNAVDSGKNFSQGFANGIDSGTYLAEAAAERLGLRALSKLSMAIQEGSPSKLTYLSGGYFEEGFSNAINDYAYRSADAARALGQDTYNALSEGFGRMDGIANGTIRTAPTIRPVLDASALQNGSRSLDTMFASRQAMYANIADQERRNNNDLFVLTGVATAILDAVNSGHALYLDGKRLIGRIDRGLGRQ